MRICHRMEINVREDVCPDLTEQELLGEDTVDLAPLLPGDCDASGDRKLQDREQALEGDPPEKIILALYDEYRPKLYRYMRSMQLGRDHADEVIQETFMRLTMELLKESKIENVQGWIVRVAHNLAVNLLKKERGQVINAEVHHFLIANRADPALSPEETYSREEQSKLMKTVLASLKPQHRECFQMRAQGFRYKDIGLALGISEQRAAFLVKQVAVRLAAICG